MHGSQPTETSADGELTVTLAFAALVLTAFIGLLILGNYIFHRSHSINGLNYGSDELDDGELKALERIQRREIGRARW